MGLLLPFLLLADFVLMRVLLLLRRLFIVVRVVTLLVGLRVVALLIWLRVMALLIAGVDTLFILLIVVLFVVMGIVAELVEHLLWLRRMNSGMVGVVDSSTKHARGSMEAAYSRNGGTGDVSSRRVASPASVVVDVDNRVCVAGGRVVAAAGADDSRRCCLSAPCRLSRPGDGCCSDTCSADAVRISAPRGGAPVDMANQQNPVPCSTRPYRNPLLRTTTISLGRIREDENSVQIVVQRRKERLKKCDTVAQPSQRRPLKKAAMRVQQASPYNLQQPASLAKAWLRPTTLFLALQPHSPNLILVSVYHITYCWTYPDLLFFIPQSLASHSLSHSSHFITTTPLQNNVQKSKHPPRLLLDYILIIAALDAETAFFTSLSAPHNVSTLTWNGQIPLIVTCHECKRGLFGRMSITLFLMLISMSITLFFMPISALLIITTATYLRIRDGGLIARFIINIMFRKGHCQGSSSRPCVVFEGLQVKFAAVSRSVTTSLMTPLSPSPYFSPSNAHAIAFL
ncbi:hypothetical protein KCU99_g407, partial [Aureobasidium melanogenum]